MTTTEPAPTIGGPEDLTDTQVLDAALNRLTTDDAVLRLSETEAEERSGYQPPTEEGFGERMIMNMGPQHPSTHGVLRLVLELDGEQITRSKPVIGYLHTGMEKTGEQLTFLQGPTNVTRMDYAAPLFNELVFSQSTEALLGVEVPERAQWIRMLLCEVNRLSSHMLFMATNGMAWVRSG
jgi:NADH-quinone oxidoreductase subunit D